MDGSVSGPPSRQFAMMIVSSETFRVAGDNRCWAVRYPRFRSPCRCTLCMPEHQKWPSRYLRLISGESLSTCVLIENTVFKQTACLPWAKQQLSHPSFDEHEIYFFLVESPMRYHFHIGQVWITLDGVTVNRPSSPQGGAHLLTLGLFLSTYTHQGWSNQYS